MPWISDENELKKKKKKKRGGSDSEYSYFSDVTEGGTRVVKRRQRIRDEHGNIIGYGKEEIYHSGNFSAIDQNDLWICAKSHMRTYGELNANCPWDFSWKDVLYSLFFLQTFNDHRCLSLSLCFPFYARKDGNSEKVKNILPFIAPSFHNHRA